MANDSDDELPRNFEDAYSSDDSDDGKPKVVDLKPKGPPKDPQANQELKLENIIQFNKRKRQKMLKTMISTQQSRAKT